MYKPVFLLFLISPTLVFANENISDVCCPGSCCPSPLAENGDQVINANKSTINQDTDTNSLLDMANILSPWATSDKTEQLIEADLLRHKKI